MPGVFLSHSSIDKEIVLRLAIDLVNRGFPVWLDTWQLGLGDQLYDHIFEGIDSSSYLVVALSKQSVQSQWVNDEIDGALAKEREVNRTFLIPVKIEECDVPPKIRGRIYADFASSYLEGLEVLSTYLRKVGLDRQEIPSQKELLPLEITRGTLLNRPAFQRRLESMQQKAGIKLHINSAQVVLSPDATRKQLKTKLLNTVERSRTSSEFTLEDQKYLIDIYQTVEDWEHRLPSSVADLVNRFCRPGREYYVSEACFWLIRIVMNEIFDVLVACQRKEELPTIDAPDTCIRGMALGEEWARFFEIRKAVRLKIFRKAGSESGSVWIDGDCSEVQELERTAGYTLGLKALPEDVIFKFVIPQVIFRKQFSDDWDVDGCYVEY